MSLEALYFGSQIVAAAAIAVSLVFVIFQIRHAARATRGQTQQAIASSWLTLAPTIADHVDAFNAGVKSTTADFADLSEADRMRFIVIIQSYFRHYENICMQALSGYIDAHIWASWSAHLRTVLAYPGVRMWWRMRSSNFSPEFQAHVNGEIAQASPTDG